MQFVLNSTVLHTQLTKDIPEKQLALHFEEVGKNDPTGHIDITINKVRQYTSILAEFQLLRCIRFLLVFSTCVFSLFFA